MKVKFEAYDGTQFEDQALCSAYERLIEPGPGNKFLPLMRELFNGCTHKTQDEYEDQVFNLSQLPKFTTNLVKLWPRLNTEFQQALNEVMKKP